MIDVSTVQSYEIEIAGERVRQGWQGLVDVEVSRVRAFAFTSEGNLLLVEVEPGLTFPGGGVEAGESAIEALNRELKEEAAARILDSARLGAVKIERLDLGVVEYHDYYWCRVVLDEAWIPTHEISQRVLVGSDQFLDALYWGHSDPKAAFLLELALAVEAKRL